MGRRVIVGLVLATLAVAGCDGGCKKSLADACGGSTWCPADVTAVRTMLCVPGHRIVITTPCGGYQRVTAGAIDTSTDYYFDSGGHLVAVVGNSANFGGSSSCVAGPSDFSAPACDTTRQTDLCPGA